MFDTQYLRKVELLLMCLPALCEQDDFAITGGTAINFITLDMPRLSVDIDLTYLPIQDRETSLHGIEVGLSTLAKTILQQHPALIIKEQKSNETGRVFKLYVYHQNTMVKIETNYVKRGTLYPIERGRLCQTINTAFKSGLTNIPVLATPELYAGKLCAALNRQHPRDLFDVKLLLESTGLTDAIRQAFVAYLVCDARPIHEVLAPHFKDIQKPYEREFKRMTAESVSADVLVETAKRLVKQIQHDLTNSEREFLLSVKQGEPDYTLLPFEHLASLPGVQWKLMNIRRMDKNKHEMMLDKLKAVLAM